MFPKTNPGNKPNPTANRTMITMNQGNHVNEFSPPVRDNQP